MSLKCLLLPLYSATQCTFSSCPLNIFHVPTELNILSCLSVGMSQMNKNHATCYHKSKLQKTKTVYLRIALIPFLWPKRLSEPNYILQSASGYPVQRIQIA